MVIKNIFFDFDGVIAESVNAKTEAFRKLYEPYGEEIAQKVVQYHIAHGGISRFEKFKYWEKIFFDKDLSEQQLAELANKFSLLVLDEVIASEEVKGVRSFLENYHNRLNFWVITGTPTTEIEIIAKQKNLSKYFRGLHGSPEKKEHWTEFLIDKFQLKREETLFLGDATTDMKAAEHSEIIFALRDNEENKTLFKSYSGMRFENFNTLEKVLAEHQLFLA